MEPYHLNFMKDNMCRSLITLMQVNNNGLISFLHPVPAFTPVPFPLVSSSVIDVTTATAQLIAPFWADVDTRDTGTVWHRESTNQTDRDRAQREIRRAFPGQAARFTPRLVFIATWDDIGYYDRQIDLVCAVEYYVSMYYLSYPSPSLSISFPLPHHPHLTPPPPPHQTNTFQCILASDGFMSYVIFLYADDLIQWTTGSASGGIGGLGGIPAQVGFNAGDMVNFASHVDSQTAAIVDIESSSIPEGRSETGMLVYRVDGSEINPAGCVDSADGEYPRGRGECWCIYRMDGSEINSAGCVDSADGEYPRGRGECWCIGWMGVRSTQLAV